MLESMPVQVNVIAQGYLEDACTQLGTISQARDGNTVNVMIKTTRPSGGACAQVITDFKETINLDVAGLKAGKYTVNVNGQTAEFELQADNVAP
jgi:inhibitor of cysteine peptidase